MEVIRKNLLTILIILGTLVLASIAIFTAIRLYQLRQTPVAPNAPESRPAAASPVAACSLSFTISTTTPTPTATPTSTPTSTPVPACNSACTTNSDCLGSMICYVGSCRNPSCTSSTSCTCSTGTPTPTATPTNSPTSTPTITSTPAPSPTVTPTTPALPVSGSVTPTILGIGAGAILLLLSIALVI